jgi:two-component system LytT family response regulator
MATQGAQVVVRTLVVDDEEHGRSVLRSMLEPEEGIEIAGEAASAADAARQIAERKPDLVFMDIEIEGGNGIELLRDLKGQAPYVIFVTAYPEFSLPAFELDAVDYLVKPVQRQRFAASVQRARLRIAEHRMAELAAQIAGAAGTLNGARPASRNAARYPDHLTIRVRRRLVALDVNDIAWIQGASQYSRVHTQNGEYLLSRTLASLECELDPKRFFRIHRSAIVNATHVAEVRSYGDGRYNVHLNGGLALPLGRARREMLQKLLTGIGERSH